MAFRINTVKADICSYPHTIIMGERKTGKTTMFRDLIIERYGSPEYGLLILHTNEPLLFLTVCGLTNSK